MALIINYYLCMKSRLLFLSFLLVFISEFSYAQFNIFKQIDLEARNTTKLDTLERKEVQVVTLNQAYERNRRKTIRLSRNYLYTENSFYLTEYGYINWDSSTANTFTGRFSTSNKHIYTINDFDVTTIFNAAYAMGNVDSVLWKTEDWFTFNSSVNYKFSNYFYYTLNIGLSSQFARSYYSKTDSISYSNFLAPATFTVGLGFNYKLDDSRSIVFTPITGNMLIVNNDRLSAAGSYGVQPGRPTEVTFGAQAIVNWKQTLLSDKRNVNGGADILTYKTYISSYWDYESRTPNLSWQNWIDIAVYKYFNISLYWLAEFNDLLTTPMGHFWRSSQTLSIGVKYSVANK